jgi:hypothetical protein
VEVPVFPEHVTLHLYQALEVTVGEYVALIAPDMSEKPAVDDVVDDCHW